MCFAYRLAVGQRGVAWVTTLYLRASHSCGQGCPRSGAHPGLPGYRAGSLYIDLWSLLYITVLWRLLKT